MTVRVYSAEEVDAGLDYRGCIAAVRDAMIILSTRENEQPLRQIVKLDESRLFGVMPGRLMTNGQFGAKLVSVFENPDRPGRSRHQGLVVVHDGADGSVSFVADAEGVTRIRTGCASAAATAVLAREDARTLAVLGTGAQAESHIRALSLVRPLDEVRLWGRSADKAAALAGRLEREIGVPIRVAADVHAATERADIICTVSSSPAPILALEHVRPGTHINVVGSSFLGPSEVESELVAASRYIADYRPSVLAQASELHIAREAGLLDESHIVAEIGEILAGQKEGRRDASEITMYKSLGHVVQDIAAASYLHNRSSASQRG